MMRAYVPTDSVSIALWAFQIAPISQRSHEPAEVQSRRLCECQRRAAAGSVGGLFHHVAGFERHIGASKRCLPASLHVLILAGNIALVGAVVVYLYLQQPQAESAQQAVRAYLSSVRSDRMKDRRGNCAPRILRIWTVMLLLDRPTGVEWSLAR